jgi:hypothetical protein
MLADIIAVKRKANPTFSVRWQFLELAFSPTPCMDLALYDPHLTAQFVGRRQSFLYREGCNAWRHGQTVLGEDFFGLMLMNVHFMGLFCVIKLSTCQCY